MTTLICVKIPPQEKASISMVVQNLRRTMMGMESQMPKSCWIEQIQMILATIYCQVKSWRMSQHNGLI